MRLLQGWRSDAREDGAISAVWIVDDGVGGGWGGSVRGTSPRRSRRQSECARGEAGEALLVGIAGRQRDLDPGDHLGDPGGDLDQGETEGVELGVAPERGLGRQAAQGVQEPVGGGVDQQAELVGGGLGAGGAVGGEVQLVRLDQVFGLAAGAVDAPRRASAARP